jgi:N-acetyltransferase 10
VIYIQPGTTVYNPDLLVVDEAAALPINVLRPMIQNCKCPIIISSTIHGYEGTGRSLSLKLVEELRKGQSGRMVQDLPMEIPIRYGNSDPIEGWLNSLLCLDINENQGLANSPPSLNDCKLYLVNKETLFSYNKSSEMFLKKIWSLFVTSHYKNSPNDI